jgi:class 3 adenylate cyclase
VDLAGFTQLTEQHGDRTAAAVAARLADMTREVVGRRQGRLVKQLGDGVLVRYPSAVASVEATLALLDAMAASDLPAGHAGVDAGPLVTRDADVFGRAVNRASRLATIATPGELIATATFADSLPAGHFLAEPMGAVELKGISHPTEVVRLSRLA